MPNIYDIDTVISVAGTTTGTGKEYLPAVNSGGLKLYIEGTCTSASGNFTAGADGEIGRMLSNIRLLDGNENMWPLGTAQLETFSQLAFAKYGTVAGRSTGPMNVDNGYITAGTTSAIYATYEIFSPVDMRNGNYQLELTFDSTLATGDSSGGTNAISFTVKVGVLPRLSGMGESGTAPVDTYAMSSSTSNQEQLPGWPLAGVLLQTSTANDITRITTPTVTINNPSLLWGEWEGAIGTGTPTADPTAPALAAFTNYWFETTPARYPPGSFLKIDANTSEVRTVWFLGAPTVTRTVSGAAQPSTAVVANPTGSRAPVNVRPQGTTQARRPRRSSVGNRLRNLFGGY